MNMMNAEPQGTVDLQGLRASLEAARRQAILGAAEADSRLDLDAADQYARIAHLQMALMAVREEIEAHLPKVGFGSETP